MVARTKTRMQHRRGNEVPVVRASPGGALGPVLYAALLVGARDGRRAVLDAGDCRDVVAQAARASGFASILLDVEALVLARAGRLKMRDSVQGGVVQGLARQVHALVQAALTSK